MESPDGEDASLKSQDESDSASLCQTASDQSAKDDEISTGAEETVKSTHRAGRGGWDKRASKEQLQDREALRRCPGGQEPVWDGEAEKP
jgi:hypothetical protein